MDVLYWTSWFAWIRFGFQLPRKTYEVFLKILAANPVELQIMRLKYEIKRIMLKYTDEGCADHGSDGPGRELSG
jgi:predicted site-specific integrase-resolvase